MALRLRIVDSRPPTSVGGEPPVFVSGATALVSWLRQSGLADEHHRVSVGPHWTQLDTDTDLVVLATGKLEPDRAITEHLLRRDLALGGPGTSRTCLGGALVAPHSPATFAVWTWR